MTSAAAFAAIFIALYVGHSIGDHWTQTGRQAAGKAACSWAGRAACARHVAGLTATQAVLLTAVHVVLAVPLGWPGLAAGLAVNAGTHWWADRRHTLAWLACVLGKETFYRFAVQRDGGTVDRYGPGTGAYALDQSWHHAWLFVAALVIAGLG